MKKISVLSMFRDSESHIFDTLNRLEELEKETDSFEFEYFFYENDSTDNTVEILSEWIKTKEGFLRSETLGRPKFSQSTAADRQFLMSDYRNRLLDSCRPLDSEYSFLLDSDVNFPPSIVNDYIKYFKDDIAMTTPNVLQNIKCKMSDSSKDSYYDSWALIDTGGTPCMTWAWNPFYKMEDREAWENEDPVEVNSAFGGCPLIKTTVLNYINWATRGGCEHWHFCEMARQYGSIIVIPEIKVKVHIEETAFPNEKAVVKRQETLLKLFSKF